MTEVIPHEQERIGMQRLRFIAVLICTAITPPAVAADAPVSAPDDFPQFVVPGQDHAMASLRDLFYLHYKEYHKRSKPMPTVWDEWMSGASLWPAVHSAGMADKIDQAWADALSTRQIDPDGYVASHQHASIAHQQGWPFPFWQQGGPGTWGWHFSLRGVPHNWDGSPAMTQEGWTLERAVDHGIAEEKWNIELTGPQASATTPRLMINPDQSPFIQLRWCGQGLGRTNPFLEWTTEEEPVFAPDRRFYFDAPPAGESIVYTMIPVYKSPTWRGRITQLRLSINNSAAAGKVGIQALFTQYDTRHNVNNASFVRGCCQYFYWTGNLPFLRANVQRMRLATRYMMENLGGRAEKCIIAPFPGHDGRSGIEWTVDGKKIIHSGRGAGNNYWDILPMGYRDAYATIRYYDALQCMARLEDEITRHPEWNLPAGPLVLEGQWLLREAQAVKEAAGKLFWNSDTGRFVAGIDRDGKAHDYGFTFINCEAVTYGFATSAQARSILQWLTGERIVPEDTSQGADIYHWRFGPRSTTKRNIDWYGWYWYAPESLPWGGQVQDGGAVLGFTYHDLMSRLRVLGPDDAWTRLRGIVAWFDEVQAAGGYRKYYQGQKEATLQGGGTCGGLGLDCEFYESLLVPQIMIVGFLGFEPRADGFSLDPKLPSSWPELSVRGIRFQGCDFDITADKDSVVITASKTTEPLRVYLPAGRWQISHLHRGSSTTEPALAQISVPDKGIAVQFEQGIPLRFTFWAD